MRTCYEYYYDKKGNRLVKNLGRTKHLGNDIEIILKSFGIDSSFKVPHVNKSNHKNHSEYFTIKLIKNYVYKKYSKDIELYKKVVNEIKILEVNLNNLTKA
jgi:hypothetical protein